jgi:hypothetical protein
VRKHIEKMIAFPARPHAFSQSEYFRQRSIGDLRAIGRQSNNKKQLIVALQLNQWLGCVWQDGVRVGQGANIAASRGY